ncbi:MAG: hypothetical protein KME16_05425 [Scytolyngbya sp. HA4215-MV1]|jgi:hypothetical protein|nr:hypothetical protein [Scytolyngbya sp. HA4215-MV1]
MQNLIEFCVCTFLLIARSIVQTLSNKDNQQKSRKMKFQKTLQNKSQELKEASRIMRF